MDSLKPEQTPLDQQAARWAQVGTGVSRNHQPVGQGLHFNHTDHAPCREADPQTL